ncbi:hypothetical protein BKA61DRAFT_260794 [Leptodontidium sp. MPI-SDFR-AT-0119]|nr:hypothetical protein BKA61DRAFT_260794 [Leptodontidium sp. MPI-SDFR-AT-0119]
MLHFLIILVLIYAEPQDWQTGVRTTSHFCPLVFLFALAHVIHLNRGCVNTTTRWTHSAPSSQRYFLLLYFIQLPSFGSSQVHFPRLSVSSSYPTQPRSR